MVNQPIGNHGPGIIYVDRFDLGPLLPRSNKDTLPSRSNEDSKI